MPGLIYYTEKRRVLPQLERTTTYSDTLNLSDIEKSVNKSHWTKPIINLREDDLEKKLSEWKKTKNDNLAGDILSQVLVSKKSEGFEEIKKHLLSNYPSDTILSWLFGNNLVEMTIDDKINHNYKKLALEPKDALTWIDQAINFISINNRDNAIECAEVAIKINSNMGFIVRNASRIFSLIGDSSRSIKLLKNSEYYKYDPQILSAEIAFSQLESRKTNGPEIADNLIKNDQYRNSEISELASTLGTIEYFKNNFKKSEKLFDLSLLDSNKNSFAQSLWYKKEAISPQQYRVYQNSNEIQTHKNSKENNFAKALEYSLNWIDDEPYSERPYRVSSHITGVLLGDNKAASDLAKRVKESQKEIKGDNFTNKDEMKFNNDIAYYLLKANLIEEAKLFIEPMLEIQNKSNKLSDSENIYIATLGLLAYRTNKQDLGRNLYRKAITYFSLKENKYLAGSAFLNFFDEEINVKSDNESLQKLRKELDVVVPDKISQNELLFRKQNSLRQFDAIVSRSK